MEKITEFRNTLAVPIHKLSIDSLVQEVCLCPEYFEDIYRLTYDEKQTVSWRAIWVCEKLSEIHPGWFILLYDEIIQRLIDCTHDGSKRLLLSILYNIPIPTPISVDLLNYCLDHMLSPQESIGVQALSIRIAYLLCRKEPELYNPQIQISAESETKRSIFREKDKTKRSKKESAQHSKSRNKSFVMTSVSAL